jgi:cytoskeletal protein CcmA (bactofilin family)
MRGGLIAMRGSMRQIKSQIVILGGVVCLCALLVAPVGAFPLNLGTYDEDKMGKQKEAEELLKDLNIKMQMDSDDIVRIGSGFTVEPTETIEGDIVIIGGGLTVKGTVEGDAVVVGGSMYLESSAVIKGDAAVVGGILEMEDGATVLGEVVENIDTQLLKEHQAALKERDRALKEKGEALKELEKLQDLGDLDLDLESEDGDIIKFGHDIYIEEDEFIDGDVVAIGGDIRIDGHVTGDVVTTAGDISIGSTARVEGDIVATFGKVTIAPGAETEGDVAEVSMGGVRGVPQASFGGWDGGGKTTYLVSLYAPDADDVRLTGDFIDWDPDGIEMEEDDGTWKTSISLGPGSYMYKFIVDGKWMADPETEERVPDGMGGYATPIIVKSKTTKSDDVTTHVFSLDRPEAHEIRISASWNDWDPDGVRLMRDEDGVWSTKVALSPGLHAYRFNVDGRWMADPDEPDKKVTDRFGREVTTVVVKPQRSDKVLFKFWHYRPDAEDMRLAGSWNDWESIPMYLDQEGNWFTYAAIPPGIHKYEFYIDGEWGPDPDVAESVPDGKGGEATEFVVKAPKPKSKVRTLTVQTAGSLKENGFSFSPAIDYNRVDGVYLAAIMKYGSAGFPEPNFYVEGGYSKKRDRGLYKFEIEQPLFDPIGLWVGGSIYDLTATQDKEIISDIENIIVASLLKFDYRDYYDLRGVAGFARINPMRSENQVLKVTYRGDEYRPLAKKADAALFRRNEHFRPNPRNMTQICRDPEWGGARVCDKVTVRAVEVEYEYDSRNCKDTPTTGTLMRLSGEFASKDWGGDLDYSRYLADLRRYQKVSPKQQIGLRLKAGVMDVPDNASCGCVPEPYYFFPKQFYAGGIGTLPGYGYKEFRGTHMLLANFEYNYLLNDELGIVFFSDAGDARGEEAALNGTWDVGEIWDQMKMRFDAGVAVRFESTCEHTLTLGVAQRLDDLDRGAVFTVRASRMF